jgi:hypothetical protein
MYPHAGKTKEHHASIHRIPLVALVSHVLASLSFHDNFISTPRGDKSLRRFFHFQ